jgi:hypothetical protein
MRRVPLLVSLAVVLAMALVQWRVSWPPAAWEQSNGLGSVTRVLVACPTNVCHVLIRQIVGD